MLPCRDTLLARLAVSLLRSTLSELEKEVFQALQAHQQQLELKEETLLMPKADEAEKEQAGPRS